MINKKAQGMSISTVILLILGLVILVVLILGFTMGWQKILPWIGGGTNLEAIKNGCGVSCSTGGQYDFCTVKKTVKDGVNDKFEATCNDLATKSTYTARQYGIAPCGDLCTK